jgi:hypothetical protein
MFRILPRPGRASGRTGRAGGDVLLRTTVASVVRAGDCGDEFVVANKDGLTAYRARMFVGCTDDATWH